MDTSSNGIIIAIALMSKTITKKDTGNGLSSELSLLARGKEDEATTTKDTEMVIARRKAMKTLARTPIAKK